MNKQQLTKTFSFSKWILFFFFAVGITLSGCGEDYDDDISDLRNQLAGMSDYQTVKSDLTNMKSALTAAQTDATKAQTDAAKALADAKAALDAANAAGGLDQAAVEAVAKAEADKAAAQAKLDAIADADAKLKAFETKMDKKLEDALSSIESGLSPADKEAIVKEVLKSLDGDMADLQEAVSKVVGHRLTSIAFIPHENINGIPAMKFYSLTYIPQTYVVHEKEKHTTTDILGADKKPVYVALSSQNMTVQYRMNPRVGVRTEDMLMPSFDCIVSTNDMTKAVDPKLAGKNTPIKPVAAGVVKDNGIYELKVTKSVGNDINREWLNIDKTQEKFYMASLNVPIAESARTADEIEKGTVPSVHSEYVRIADQIVTPFLKQAGSVSIDNSDDVYDAGSGNTYPHLNEIDATGKWIHYHDSTSLYQSAKDELIDHYADWKNGIDLKKLVDVCIIQENHKSLENYKAYGLTFRFYLAKDAYKQGTNQTDQQQFAVIDSPQNGYMTSKTYTIGGEAQTAIDREPIVRAMLVDTVNNKLVAQRYIKLKWTTTGEDLPAYTFPTYYVSCDTISLRFGTQAMNEKVYRQVQDIYGLSKTAFHALYDNVVIESLHQDGKEITNHNLSIATDITKSEAVINSVPEGTPIAEAAADDYTLLMLTDPDPNMSWNLLWTLSPEAVGKVGTTATPRKSTYELVFKFTSTKGGQAIKMKFIVDIAIPDQVFNYLQPAWKDGKGQGVFNVNPIVYDTPTDGAAGTVAAPAVLKDYSHIQADLMNGWMYSNQKPAGWVGANEWADGTNKKPANVAQFIRMIRSCADVQFVFDKSRFANYPHLAKYVVGKNGVEVTNGNYAWKDAVELWEGPIGTANMTSTYLIGETPTYAAGQEETPTDNYDYVQPATMAASISNIFGATAEENKKNLAWNKDEILGVGGYLNSGADGVANGTIRLHETDKLTGTPSAIKLIGKNVPVNLIVEYNPYNVVTEQKFEVHFINPLTVNSNISGNFVDAKVNGSYLDANKGLSFTDWNSYIVARTDNPDKSTDPTGEGKDLYPWDLWNYYAVKSVAYGVDKVKTSLTWSGDTYVHNESVKNGELPTDASLKQTVLTWDPVKEDWDYINYVEVTSNPTHLGYFNNAGTPVNTNFWLYIPVSVNYKWGALTGEPVKVEVVKAGGTPSNPTPTSK